MKIRLRFHRSPVRVSVLTGSLLAFALLAAIHPRANGAPALPVPAGAAPASGASSAVATALPASTPVAEAVVTDSDGLAALQSRLSLLRVKKEIAEVQAAIDKLKYPSVSGMPPVPNGPFVPMAGPIPGAPSAAMPVRQVGDVTLAGTGSYDGRSMATVVIGGVARDVQVGDTLDDGWKVTRIEGNGIQLVRGGRVRWVRF
ncbi:TPA: type IV pilus biogenesis protein PilP [Burkholderia orbicola]|nr:type IV pilus biogenesis protein PilP [Burkholderia cenocepacia]